ncbi:ParB family chromosome partitioning protein [Pacificibacter maritimus]|uniref:ParB family chromosome partitioning protein n=1 Tax=Pacificibacter maritimus TaxID=762213 RepID=A0A3N4TWJ3_9RHOB|nr:ParB N-terminal domain-containing protein [Pacificibacter maritimus]RPE62923.1 ParB family chromosome partitioning protein [Pacificibacter maritimus]
MAKRRKLVAPSATDLDQIEQEFRGETPSRSPLSVPIAQVAAEAASAHDPRSLEMRAQAAKNETDAKTLHEAQSKGLIIIEIPVSDIHADALVRDRVVLDAEQMNELQLSIAKSGLRLPIEVFELAQTDTDQPYGLLSGYRRLHAIKALRDLTGDPKYDTVKAILRDPDAMGGTFAAMIEENEIRAALSHFERGRISVIAAQQGVFENTEAAVNGLFPMASKAKRSKIRSFALIFEELGDMLKFPDLIKEKEGLKIAAALRDGYEAKLRNELALHSPTDPAHEAAILDTALAGLDPVKPNPKKGGRPKKTTAGAGRSVTLKSGVQLTSDHDGSGWLIRVNGSRVDRELIEVAMGELSRLLDAD